MYIRPIYQTKRLYIIRDQIKSIKGESLIDSMIIQPPQELIDSSISLYFETKDGIFILEAELTSNYQTGEIQYNVPSTITIYPNVKYKIKSSNGWESEFGFIYFKKDLVQGGEL